MAEDLKDAPSLESVVESLAKTVGTLTEQVQKAAVVNDEWLKSRKAPAVVVGESSVSSRPFSFARLAKGILSRKGLLGHDYREDSKLEMDLCSRLSKEYSGTEGNSGYMVPLDWRAIPQDQSQGLESIAKEWRQANANPFGRGVDQDEFAYVAKELGYEHIAKTLTAGVGTTGGTFIPNASQGEMIDLLRAQALFGGVVTGLTEVTLPPQGAIEFPVVTSGTTISAYAESTATSESTPGTGQVRLEARQYSGLVKMTERFLTFSTSVAGDAFVRTQLALDTDLKVDRDIMYGTGGIFIKGLVTYSGITSRTASTVATDGNTLGASDIDYLIADMEDANVPPGAVILMRNKLLAALKHRTDDNSTFLFDVAKGTLGGGSLMQVYSGRPIYGSSQISNTRAKGSGTDLTNVFAIVPSEIMIGRGPVMSIDMTNSDGSDFQSGILTMRSTTYVDAAPKHATSIGVIDELLNA